jgi:hypothetical protein
MPIPVYNEAAQRYQNEATGKFVKTKDAEAQIAAQKGKGSSSAGAPVSGSSLGAIAGPIVSSLRKEFSGLNAHLAFRFEDIKQAILAPKAESRAERLAGEDVVVPPEGGDTITKKGFLGRLKDRFDGGIGEKTKILLLVGALALLMKFGDKLVKPLASTLEWFDKEGSILDKLKDAAWFKSIVEVFKKIEAKAELVVADVLLWFDSFESFQKNVEDIKLQLEKAVETAQASYAKIKKTVEDMDLDKQFKNLVEST